MSDKLSTQTQSDEISNKKRTLLKALASGGTVASAGYVIPATWSKPAVQSVILPAHAQTTTEGGGGAVAGGNGFGAGNQIVLQMDPLGIQHRQIAQQQPKGTLFDMVVPTAYADPSPSDLAECSISDVQVYVSPANSDGIHEVQILARFTGCICATPYTPYEMDMMIIELDELDELDEMDFRLPNYETVFEGVGLPGDDIAMSHGGGCAKNDGAEFSFSVDGSGTPEEIMYIRVSTGGLTSVDREYVPLTPGQGPLSADSCPDLVRECGPMPL